MIDIFVVDTRTHPALKKADLRLPFQRFYLIPGAVPLEKFRRLVPFSLVVNLTKSYEPVLTSLGIPFQTMLDRGYRVMIPLQMTRNKAAPYKKNKVYLSPQYLTTQPWTEAEPNFLAEFFPDDGVTFLTPEEVVTPVCLACDHHLGHMIGECVLGTPFCTEHLSVRYTPTKINLVPLSLEHVK